MQATIFEAVSMREAIKKVKQELGRDAVIISTREKDAPLLPGGKPQKIIEVLATPAATVNRKDSSGKVASSPSPDNLRVPSFPKIATRETATVIRSGRPATGNLPPLPAKDGRPAAVTSSIDKSASGVLSGDIARGTVELESQKIREVQRELQAQIEQLKSEIKCLPQVNIGEQVQEMKVILHDILRLQAASRSGTEPLHPEIEEIAIRLRAAGVLPSIISELTRNLVSLNKGSPSQDGDGGSAGGQGGQNASELYLAATIRFILREIQTAPSAFGATGTQEIHVFIGPSGAGKTTTLAKIGAMLGLKKGLRVALVSMDSMKVGAADQLRVFSKILGLEFAELRDSEELEAFAQKRYDFDVILVDTVGRPATTKSQHDFIRVLKSSILPIRFHILLSAAMKNRDMEETVRAYQFTNPSSILFSKLDESWAFGEIFNIASSFKIPISLFGTGPNVPDDLEMASKERVVERLLRI